jgi:hypothetical protein
VRSIVVTLIARQLKEIKIRAAGTANHGTISNAITWKVCGTDLVKFVVILTVTIKGLTIRRKLPTLNLNSPYKSIWKNIQQNQRTSRELWQT